MLGGIDDKYRYDLEIYICVCVKQKWNKKKVEYLCCSYKCIVFLLHVFFSSISLRLLHFINFRASGIFETLMHSNS